MEDVIKTRTNVTNNFETFTKRQTSENKSGKIEQIASPKISPTTMSGTTTVKGTRPQSTAAFAKMKIRLKNRSKSRIRQNATTTTRSTKTTAMGNTTLHGVPVLDNLKSLELSDFSNTTSPSLKVQSDDVWPDSTHIGEGLVSKIRGYDEYSTETVKHKSNVPTTVENIEICKPTSNLSNDDFGHESLKFVNKNTTAERVSLARGVRRPPKLRGHATGKHTLNE
jgi:hypothetical protein